VLIKHSLPFLPAFLLILISTTSIANTIEKVVPTHQNHNQYKNIIPEFTAEYTVLHKADPVGTAIRSLSYQTDGNINYHYTTYVEWLIFSQTRSETSILKIMNNEVTPINYKSSREGTGKDKYYEWHFNASENLAEDIERKKTHTVDFSHNLQDKLSYHLQHRLNLISDATQPTYTYSVINTSGSTKNYTYEYDGDDELVLPYGLLKTVRFKREVKDKERITYAWFAPDFDYLLVKLYQTKSGNEQFEAQLSSYTIKEKVNH
jgi:hypothetical protein